MQPITLRSPTCLLFNPTVSFNSGSRDTLFWPADPGACLHVSVTLDYLLLEDFSMHRRVAIPVISLCKKVSPTRRLFKGECPHITAQTIRL